MKNLTKRVLGFALRLSAVIAVLYIFLPVPSAHAACSEELCLEEAEAGTVVALRDAASLCAANAQQALDGLEPDGGLLEKNFVSNCVLGEEVGLSCEATLDFAVHQTYLDALEYLILFVIRNGGC
jgi:hypothetical protein